MCNKNIAFIEFVQLFTYLADRSHAGAGNFPRRIGPYHAVVGVAPSVAKRSSLRHHNAYVTQI